MPDVDVLEQTNGHHEEVDVLSPLDGDGTHPVSASDAAAGRTDETAPLVGHVEEETKGEPPAEKITKTTATRPPVKKARVIVPFARPRTTYL